MRHAGQNQIGLAHDALRQALHYEFGIGPHAGKPENPVLLYLQRMLDTRCSPSLVAAFARVACAEKNFSTARTLFCRYLEINPHAFDRDQVEKTIAHLEVEIQRRATPSTWLDRAISRIRFLLSVMKPFAKT